METTSDVDRIKPVEAKEAHEPLESQQLSPTGIKAVQGFQEPTEGTLPDAEKIHHVAPKEYVADVPSLTSSAANDLELSAQRAMAAKATHYHELGGGKIHEYHRLRSEITEDLASQNIEKGVRADSYSTSGTNFPTYDVFGSSEVSSVKAYSLKDGAPRYGAYRTALIDIADQNSPANQKAATELLKIKNSDPERWQAMVAHMPAQVSEATSVDQLSHGLAETSTLHIPADQVEPVRQYMYRSVMRDPGKFGITASGDAAEIESKVHKLVDSKVISIDDRFQTAHYQGKAADLSHLRDLNLKRLN